MDAVSATLSHVRATEPAGLARAHREAWASALCAGRPTLALDAEADPVLALASGSSDATAVTWLDGPSTPDAVADPLQAVVERGHVVVVTVPRELGLGAAERLATAIGAEIVPQYLAEGSLIGTDWEDAASTSEGAHIEDAHAWLLVANASRNGQIRGSLQLAAARDSELAALRTANAELRRANARLARRQLGRHDSSAASVIGPLEQRVLAAEAHAENLEELLETEKEMSGRNHAMYLGVRKQLDAPRYKAVDKVRDALTWIPGLQRLTRAIARLLARR